MTSSHKGKLDCERRLAPTGLQGASGLAKAQAWLHIAGAIVFPVGVGIVTLNGSARTVIPIVGSLIVVAVIGLFGVILFRTAQAWRAALPSLLKPIRGIVIAIDSHTRRLKYMKRYA